VAGDSDDLQQHNSQDRVRGPAQPSGNGQHGSTDRQVSGDSQKDSGAKDDLLAMPTRGPGGLGGSGPMRRAGRLRRVGRMRFRASPRDGEMVPAAEPREVAGDGVSDPPQHRLIGSIDADNQRVRSGLQRAPAPAEVDHALGVRPLRVEICWPVGLRVSTDMSA
jgi:hypothetical protein